jgi:hypothetical protein
MRTTVRVVIGVVLSPRVAALAAQVKPLAAARAPRWFGGHQGFSRAR